MADGHLGKCKECAKWDVARNYFANHEHYLEYEKSRLDNPKRREARKQYSRWLMSHHPETVKRYKEKYSKTQKKASEVMNNALRSGKIKKQPCAVCGDIKSEGHHEDYGSPLDVIWLCRKHHGYVHRFSGEERGNIIESIKSHRFNEKKAS